MTKIAENTIKPIMVFNDIELDECVVFLEKSKEISLDLEFDKNRLRFGFNLCLMQIFCENKCFIIDPLSKSLDIRKVFPVLENPEIIKIVFAFGEDLRLLLSLGCQPKNIYDLAILSRLMDYPAMSLSNLLLEVKGIESAKSSQLSDWFKRPLTDRQLHYAADDVVFLPAIKQTFEEDERFQMISPWFKEESIALESLIYINSDEGDTFLKRKDKLKMTQYEWYLFVELMKFRNETAKSFNRPPHFIMPTDLIKEIVENPKILNRWQELPRVFKRIKTNSFKKKIIQRFNQADLFAQENNLSKNKAAIPSLSVDEKRINRTKRSEEDRIKKEVFKPIQEELIASLGANTTNYVFSNRVISDLVTKTNTILPYRKKLVEKAGLNLGFELDEFL